MLWEILLSIILPCAIFTSTIMLSIILLSVIQLNVILPSIILLSVSLQNIILQSAILLSIYSTKCHSARVIFLNDILMRVAVPARKPKIEQKAAYRTVLTTC